MASTHQRVLFSGLGDGNWTGIFSTLSGVNERRYFPKGDNATTAPTAIQQIGGSQDYIGWNSKTNWIIQVANSGGGTGTIQVIGVRPTGVEEELVPATAIGAAATLSQGGIGGEEIYGPFSYFTFIATSNSGVLECHVIGWNYGNIWDAQV